MSNTIDLSAHTETLNEVALNQLFLEARTHSFWLDKPIPDSLLEEAYNFARMGPTSANCSPARILFIKTEEAKARLLPAVSAGNQDKTRTAPVISIIAYDVEFYDKLPQLFPQVDARSWFTGNLELARETAFRNGSLQGAYFILAARALGLDCGPMSGFDKDKVNAEFFPDGKWKANFLCNLGYGDDTKLHPRLPRLSFDEACALI